MIDLGDGKVITLTSDHGITWLQVCANRGSLGVQLNRKHVVKLIAALIRIESESKSLEQS